MLDESYIDGIVHVEEADTVRACYRMARHGFLFGGSTGTVVSGALSWLAEQGRPDMTAVAIAPDLGERYLDTVYQTNWVQALYGDEVIESQETVHSPSV
jgi:cysteine synthase A